VTLIASAGPSAYWYLARATGAVALILLTASVVLGILGSVRFASAPRWPRFAIDTVHRDVSLLVLAVLVIHIITSVLDSFAPIRLIDAVLPFGSAYRPLWMGLGAFSFDLLLAVLVTSLLRRRIGYQTWRAVHWLTYASWPVAVLHGLGTGSDVKSAWMLMLTVACVGAVIAACFSRIARAGSQIPGLRPAALALSIATPLGLAIFALAGPLERGWARRAGTPTHLLAQAVAPAATASIKQVVQSSSDWSHRFSANLNGTITQTNVPGGAIVDMALDVSGGVHGRLHVRLTGTPIAGGGLSMTASRVELSAADHPSVLKGQITELQGQQFLAHVSDSDGSQVDLQAILNIDITSRSVSGSLSGTPAPA
jgi:hypothetical protein